MSVGRMLFEVAAAWAGAWLVARFGGMHRYADVVAGCTTVGILLLAEVSGVSVAPRLLPVSVWLIAAAWVLGHRLDAEDEEERN